MFEYLASCRRVLPVLHALPLLLMVLSLLLLAVWPAVVTSAASPPSDPSSASSSPSSDRQSRELYCALCEAVMDEMEAAIERVDRQHAHTVQTAWRIDEKRRIPYARTESVLLQLLEDDVPPLLRHYGVSNHTGRQRLIRRPDAPQLDTAPLLPDDETSEQLNGAAADSDSSNSSERSSNSSSHTALPYSATEFAYSPLVTDTLTALYERMIDSYLEDIMLAFHKRQHNDVKDALCVKTIKACKKGTTFEPFRRPARRTQPAAHAPEPPQQQQQHEHQGQPHAQTHTQQQTAEQIGHIDL